MSAATEFVAWRLLSAPRQRSPDTCAPLCGGPPTRAVFAPRGHCPFALPSFPPRLLCCSLRISPRKCLPRSNDLHPWLLPTPPADALPPPGTRVWERSSLLQSPDVGSAARSPLRGRVLPDGAWCSRGRGGGWEAYLPVFGPTGRPKGVREQDVYICDYRLDKSAHLFYKIHRNRYPVCTRPYAFDHFPKRLTPRRDFSVSAAPPSPLRAGAHRRGSPVALCASPGFHAGAPLWGV